LDTEIKNYASSLYEKSLMDSVKQLQEEKANYLARRSGTSSALLSGSEIRAVIDQHVRHIERCMTARLESYRKAFTDANQNPTEHDFITIFQEAQNTREQQIKNSTAAVRNFIGSKGGPHLPAGVLDASIKQITNASGHGHDRMLREWKIWRDKTRLAKPATIEPGHMQNGSAGSARNLSQGENVKSAFISYSWDDDTHRDWVRRLAERLRADGVDVSIDRWAVVPGDQLPAFMEKAIRDNEFVAIICTPRYKQRSDTREGGVGYEGDIMTAEVMSAQKHRKFIPVWRSGSWQDAAPSWLSGKYYINLTGDPYSERDYEDLVCTLLGIRETAPPLGKPMSTITPQANQALPPSQANATPTFEDIKITRVIVEDITAPRNDGTHGSALYSIPFALSRRPPSEWAQMFGGNWSHPPRFTSMHRPGIAKAQGATITLNGTTIEEVERCHRDTLQLAVAETNKQYRERQHEQQQREAQERVKREEHRKYIEDSSKRIKFD
jgi:TIR domain